MVNVVYDGAVPAVEEVDQVVWLIYMIEDG